MPNWCAFDMRVVGSTEELGKFLKILKRDDEKVFYRTFDIQVYGTEQRIDNAAWDLFGECAWSVASCMLKEYCPDDCLNLEDVSRGLGLDIEVYSKEPGMAFAEHYVIKHGVLEVDETENYFEYWWDKSTYPSFENFRKAFRIPESLTEEDFDDESAYSGGFEVEWTI